MNECVKGNAVQASLDRKGFVGRTHICRTEEEDELSRVVPRTSETEIDSSVCCVGIIWISFSFCLGVNFKVRWKQDSLQQHI